MPPSLRLSGGGLSHQPGGRGQDSPPLRATIREGESGRNWQRYAERTMDYAFGMAGDRDLERNVRYQELWRRIEGLEEREREAGRVRMR